MYFYISLIIFLTLSPGSSHLYQAISTTDSNSTNLALAVPRGHDIFCKFLTAISDPLQLVVVTSDLRLFRGKLAAICPTAISIRLTDWEDLTSNQNIIMPYGSAIILDLGTFPASESLMLDTLRQVISKTTRRAPCFLFFTSNLQYLQFNKFLVQSLMKELTLDGKFYIVREGMERAQHVEEVYYIKGQRISTIMNTEQVFRGPCIRHDFKGLRIVCVVMVKNDSAADNTVAMDHSSGVRLIDGFGIEQFSYLGDSLNFRIGGIPGDGWLSLDTEGKVQGIGRQVIEGEADISIDSSELVPYRVKQLGFLHASFEERLNIFFKQPPVGKGPHDIYLQNLNLDLWLVACISFMVIGYSLSLLKGVTTKRNESENQKYGALMNSKPGNILICISSMISQRGTTMFMESAPTYFKIALLTGTATSLILHSGYSATLISILKRPFLPIRALQDIKNYRMAVYADIYTLAARPALYEFPDSSVPTPIDRDEGIDKIMYSVTASAYIAPSYRLQPFDKPEHCSTISRILLNIGPPNLSGMFVGKGSLFKEAFNQKILEMRERGIRNRATRRYFRLDNLEGCFGFKKQTGSNPVPVEIADTFTGAAILVTGFLSALGILIIEKCRHKVVIKLRRNMFMP